MTWGATPLLLNARNRVLKLLASDVGGGIMLNRRKAILAVLSLPTACSLSGSVCAAGSYSGRIVTEWLADHRKMRLVEPFEYIGPGGRRWPVPAGTVVDGASIPQAFWTIIGGPFEGAYRPASVIHDYYCDTRTRAYKDVHRVFYDAMLTSGVKETKAWLMFQAVERFGPSWADPKIDRGCEIVDENYDYNRCTRNWHKPTRIERTPTEQDILEFLKQQEGTADETDLSLVRRQMTKNR